MTVYAFFFKFVLLENVFKYDAFLILTIAGNVEDSTMFSFNNMI